MKSRNTEPTSPNGPSNSRASSSAACSSLQCGPQQTQHHRKGGASPRQQSLPPTRPRAHPSADAPPARPPTRPPASPQAHAQTHHCNSSRTQTTTTTNNHNNNNNNTKSSSSSSNNNPRCRKRRCQKRSRHAHAPKATDSVKDELDFRGREHLVARAGARSQGRLVLLAPIIRAFICSFVNLSIQFHSPIH